MFVHLREVKHIGLVFRQHVPGRGRPALVAVVNVNLLSLELLVVLDRLVDCLQVGLAVYVECLHELRDQAGALPLLNALEKAKIRHNNSWRSAHSRRAVDEHQFFSLHVEQAVEVLSSDEETGTERIFRTQIVDWEPVALDVVIFVMFFDFFPINLALLKLLIGLEVDHRRHSVLLHFYNVALRHRVGSNHDVGLANTVEEQPTQEVRVRFVDDPVDDPDTLIGLLRRSAVSQTPVVGIRRHENERPVGFALSDLAVAIVFLFRVKVKYFERQRDGVRLESQSQLPWPLHHAVFVKHPGLIS